MGDGDEIVIGQYHVRGFLGRLGAVHAHRHADVGAFQRRGVVDPVAGHRHHLMVGLQGCNQPQLVLGTGAGVHIGVHNHRPQRFIVHRLQFRAGQRLMPIADPDLGGDGPRGDAVVASDHLDPDAGLLGLPHRPDGFLARRIANAQQSQQDQAVLDILKGQLAAGLAGWAERHRQHPLAGRGQFLHPPPPVIQPQRLGTLRALFVRAHRPHLFRRTLDVDDAVAVMVVVQGGHEAVFGFEGNAVHPVEALLFGDRIEAGLVGQRQQRALGGIALHPPFAVLLAQRRVVAQARGAGDGLANPPPVRAGSARRPG